MTFACDALALVVVLTWLGLSNTVKRALQKMS